MKHTDTELLNFLQKITTNHKYTGNVILRDSTNGRGWRLYETSQAGAVPDVRQAIENYIEQTGSQTDLLGGYSSLG